MRTVPYYLARIGMNQNRRNDIIFLTKYLGKLIDKDFDSRLAKFDLTGQQGRILFYIAKRTNCDNQDVHQNDIEQEYHLSKSTVSGIVKRMEKKGIITIEKQHPYAVLKPTDAGEKIIESLHSQREEAFNILLKDLSEEEKEQICKLLNKLIENMEGGN